MKALVLLVGILLLAVGIGCLNYTTAHGAEHHQAWARRHELPMPSPTVFYAGAVLVTAGAGTVGFVLGRRHR